MSILIDGMDMPKYCIYCPLFDGENEAECKANAKANPKEGYCFERRSDCPLVEIVKCKDCKYHFTHKCNGIVTEICDIGNSCGDADHDFCSYGERKEGSK